MSDVCHATGSAFAFNPFITGKKVASAVNTWHALLRKDFARVIYFGTINKHKPQAKGKQNPMRDDFAEIKMIKVDCCANTSELRLRILFLPRLRLIRCKLNVMFLRRMANKQFIIEYNHCSYLEYAS